MIRPNSATVKGTGKLAADDPDAFKGFPRWRGFFLDQVYADGKTERQPGLLILRPTGDGWQWTLKDCASCTMLRYTSRTHDEGILMGEAFLDDENAPWETDPYESAKRAKSRGRKT